MSHLHFEDLSHLLGKSDPARRTRRGKRKLVLRYIKNTKPDSPKALMWKDVREIRRVFDSLND